MSDQYQAPLLPPPTNQEEARQTVEHLEEWCRRQQVGQGIYPEVQRQLEYARWFANASPMVEPQTPTEIKAPITKGVDEYQVQLREKLPLPPLYEGFIGTEVSTGSTHVYSQVHQALVQVSEFPGAPPKIFQIVTEYRELQESQDRIRDARQRLGALFPPLLPLFDEAQNRESVARTDSAKIDGAANSMRTLLYKL